MGRVTVRRRTQRVTLDSAGEPQGRSRPDTIVVEEPLELRIGSTALTVTMRTPGHDIEWLHGFLHSEGIITAARDVLTARYCAGAVMDDGTGVEVNTYNVIEVQLAPHVADPVADGRTRSFFTSSACGVCGKASIEDLDVRASYDVAGDSVRVQAGTLLALPDRLREAQSTFERTGGLHAAGLFTAEGEPVVVREDVGRHNAVDKVIGWAIQKDLLPLRGHVLQVSGRLSFELTQKAYLAGVPVLSAVSAPSSLALDTAEHAGVTLAGFVRGQSLNLYTHPERVLVASS
ncbi:MAG TPA: formate dehydrogenase accessory sulfurtransferase FdhD [Ornithinimicrobium sp.]|uniref:formate dehydrogenase accessory sulfurtransferase FdhD n=1 Tax=Ornithinimicrobium sp. TaxID=1977084 RepID=UPI002B481C5F|nr:formate dehydrogenase accessory sulfurtransferase FdhD [Ornithinimicrobium sp.]HKJ11533.1 formate dehydrogenase accessory sulfurtransferase FdhD [Ornithinimicrobium sp.]